MITIAHVITMVMMQPVLPHAPAGPATPAEASKPSEPSVQEAAVDDNPVICRRKMVPHPTMENRPHSIKVCKTKEEWAQPVRKKRR
jgi:hypothetical protein